MTLFIALISLFAIAGVTRLLRRLGLTICPICAGTAGTWLWMLVLRPFGYPADPLILGLLIGASISGIAYQLEKRLPSGRSPFLWKMLFIPSGFIAGYGVILWRPVIFLPALLLLGALSLFFFVQTRKQGTKTSAEEIKKKMADCC